MEMSQEKCNECKNSQKVSVELEDYDMSKHTKHAGILKVRID